jgi:AcrR family transcriptional regulator
MGSSAAIVGGGLGGLGGELGQIERLFRSSRYPKDPARPEYPWPGRYAPGVARRQRLRRDESQAQTREALLAAALQLFDDKGFAATSITDIADQAGYTTGAVYSNFANKDDLFLAVLERQVTIEIAALQEALADERSMGARLEVVGRWYASQAGQGRRRTRALAELALLAGSRETAHARLRDQRRFFHDAVEALLQQQAAELGIEFRLPLPTLASTVLALLEGFALGSAIGDDDADSAAALVAGLEMLLRPVAPPERPEESG